MQEEEQRGHEGVRATLQDPARERVDRHDRDECDGQGQQAQPGRIEPDEPAPPGVQRERERRWELVVRPERLDAHVPPEDLDRLEIVLLVAPWRPVKRDHRHEAEPAGGHNRHQQGDAGARISPAGRQRPNPVPVAARQRSREPAQIAPSRRRAAISSSR